MTGQALRRELRRPRQVKLSAVWRCIKTKRPDCDGSRQRQGQAFASGPTIHESNGLSIRFLRGPTMGHLKVEGEPSRLATSSPMSSNPASAGSGDY
jgi:hypothetical protein